MGREAWLGFWSWYYRYKVCRRCGHKGIKCTAGCVEAEIAQSTLDMYLTLLVRKDSLQRLAPLVWIFSTEVEDSDCSAPLALSTFERKVDWPSQAHTLSELGQKLKAQLLKQPDQQNGLYYSKWHLQPSLPTFSFAFIQKHSRHFAQPSTSAITCADARAFPVPSSNN